MSLYLVPQWLLARTYDWVDLYRLVCAPTIAGFRPLVYCFARVSASARPSSDWNGRRPFGLEWERLPDDWNVN